MKKKGFTLIELLAVIVILAIIALIAIPLIGNVIEKAKIGALENSVNGLIESANMYYANQSIKGEQATEIIFDFANGEQTSTEKLEYKGKVYNGKLILHANGEVAVCIDDKEHYAYKNKDSDEIISGIGTCLYDGTTGDFSSNSSINDLRGKTVVATSVSQSADGLSTLITIPEEGHYDTNSKISVLNSNLVSDGYIFKDGTLPITGNWIVKMQSGGSVTIDDKIRLINTGGNSPYTQIACITEKPIDLTDYNWIVFKPYAISGYSSNSNAHLGIFETNSWTDNNDWKIIDKTDGKYDYGSAVQCLDISDKSGYYYIGFYSSYEPTTAYDVKEIILLK